MKAVGYLGVLCTLSLLAGCTVANFGATDNRVEGRFERSLPVSGDVDLDVSTDGGRISIQAGDPERIAVRAEIRVGESGRSQREAQELVARLEATPPIEQTGNTIRIGDLTAYGNPGNVVISYEIEVPAQTTLRSRTGSGSQDIGGVAGPLEISAGSGALTVSNVLHEVHAQTGSGSIRLVNVGSEVSAWTGSGRIVAEGIEGGFIARTGSGSVRLGQTAPGDVEVSTGSGSVALTGVRGGLTVHTGSGGINVAGEPAGEWDLDTGQGSVVVRMPEGAAFDLRARSNSGTITVDHPVVVNGTIGRNSVTGVIRGGGPMIDVRTGSGSVRIE